MTVVLTTPVVTEDPDNSLCKNRGPVSDVVGIPLPPLPNQFHAIFEANILQKSYTVYQEEYYDYLGNRGVIITTRNGRSMKAITDFITYSVHQIDLATGKCMVQDLRQMKSTLFNFTSTATGGHVKGLADIFKFSSKFNESYVGTTKIRGIPAHHWTTCLHVEGLKAIFNMDYFFSLETYDIVGVQKEIPLRTVINGIASNVDHNNMVLNGTHNFNHVYDFISFTPGPIKDTAVFQIPPGIICTGSKVHKQIPKIADQVSFGLEKINKASTLKPTVPVYMQVDYDFTSKLARLDLSQVPSIDLKKAFGNDSISLIQDFHIGVQYVIDSLYGNCSVTELTASFNDFIQCPSYLLPPEMRHPIALLEVNYSSMVYQGKKIYRGLPVESWGKIDNVTNFIHEIYFKQIDHSIPGPITITSDSTPVPVGIYTSIGDVHNTQSKSTIESYTNIYNYIPNRIDPSRFDIRQCYTKDSTFKQLHLAIQTDDPMSVLSKKLLYLNHIHQFISKTAKIQPTRISDLYISTGLIDNTVSVYFILLDKSPMPPGRHSNTNSTPSLQEAFSNLESAIKAGTTVKLENQSLPVVKTSLYKQQPVKSTSKTEQGYSSGSMAGLGIGMLATGILCGLAGTYMIQRRKDTSVPYELQ